MAVLLAYCILMAQSKSAQLIPKPSVPEFTVYLVNHPYDVPSTSPTYTTDPYTGEQKLVTPGSAGYHVDNFTIELWILNQQPSYSNGTTTFMPYYDVRTKGYYEQNWTELGYSFNAKVKMDSNETRAYFMYCYPIQYGSKYTVLTYSSTSPARYHPTDSVTYPPNATVDFQVKTVVGHTSPMVEFASHGIIGFPFDGAGTALDVQSDWSETQSITINQNNTVLASTLENPTNPQSTPIPLPTDTPHATSTPATTKNPEITATQKPTSTNTIDNSQALSVNTLLLIIAAIALPIVVIAVLLFVRNRKLKRSTQEPN